MANQNQCHFTGRIGKLDIRCTQDKTPITVFSLSLLVNQGKITVVNGLTRPLG